MQACEKKEAAADRAAMRSAQKRLEIHRFEEVNLKRQRERTKTQKITNRGMKSSCEVD